MGNIVELYPESEIQALCETPADADRSKQRDASLEAFLRLQDAIERGAAAPVSELSCACYEFVRLLLAAAPEDVIRDIAYVIILYLKKEEMAGQLKVE
jgi:hypothetical protein